MMIRTENSGVEFANAFNEKDEKCWKETWDQGTMVSKEDDLGIRFNILEDRKMNV